MLMGERRSRVLMVSQPTTAGVAQCVLDWSLGLAGSRWDVSVACPEDGWLQAKLAQGGIPVHPWESQRSPTAGLRSESAALRAIIAQTGPDVIFAHSSKAGLVARVVNRNQMPLVFAPHSWSFEAVHGAIASAALRWERFAARWTDRFICVSDAERDLGMRSKIRGRYVVARNGIEVDALRPVADRAGLREALGIGAGEVALICVGRLSEQKGQDVLLAAWPHVQAPDRTLTFVGDGPDEQQLRASVDDPRVRFVGHTDREVALQWLAAADLVVLPSRWEGMALVPLESLAVGTPVVASDVNGAHEAITDDVGALCPADDPVALASAVNAWLATPRPAARTAARARVEQGFDLAQTVDTIDRTLRSTVGERP